MKILHTADWHLGKRLERFSRLEEQKEVLEEIVLIADEQQVDLVIIAGDLFDTYNPSSEAVEVFYRTLKRLSNGGKRAIIAIAGNHDSPDRIEAPHPLARECGIFFAGYPDVVIPECELESGVCVKKTAPGFIELTLPYVDYPVRVLLSPYANEYRLKTFLGVSDTGQELRDHLSKFWNNIAEEHCDEKGVNLLAAHLFFMKKGEAPPEEPDDEKPILHIGGAQAIFTNNIPNQIQYAALGHIHRMMVIDMQPCPVIYSSSPLSYSFGEAGQQKYVIIVDASPNEEVSYNHILLSKGKKLVRIKFDNIDKAVGWLNNNQGCLLELTVDTENYLTSEDRKRLYQAHSGIVTIIPNIQNKEFKTQRTSIDLTLDIEDLFIQFFQHRTGQLPAAEHLSLFKEVRAQEVNE